MLKWLERQMPHASVPANDPIFNAEIRSLRWGQLPQHLKRYSLKVWVIVFGITFCLWALWMVVEPHFVLQNTDSFMGLLLFISLGINAVLDFVSVSTTMNSFSVEVNTGRLDLLRLTDLGLEMFIRSKHAAAQIRVWRMMIIVSSIRGCIAMVFAFRIFIFPSIDFFNPISLLLILIFLVLSLLAVLEPLWEIRMFTAIGLDISVRSPNQFTASLRGLITLGAVWL